MKPEDDMNIILVGKRHGKSRTVSVNAPVLAGAVLFVTALLVLAGWSGGACRIGIGRSVAIPAGRTEDRAGTDRAERPAAG